MKPKFEIGMRVIVTGDPEYKGMRGFVSEYVQDDPCTCCPGQTNVLIKVIFDGDHGWYELFANGDLELEGS